MSDIAHAMKCSVRLLHRVTASERMGMLSFCCEGQPLATIRSYGLPARCPICQQMNPLRDKQAKNPQERGGIIE